MKSEDVSRSLLFLCGSDGKTSAYSAGNLSSIPGSGRSPGEGNGNPLQYSCLKNPMDRGAWQAIAHGVTESDRAERLSTTAPGSLAGYSPWGCRVGQKWEALVTQPCPTLWTPWTTALQAPLSMEFSRQEYWSRLPFISSGDLPDPGMELRFPAL